MQSPRLLFVMTVALDFRAFLLPIAAHFRRLGWRVDGASAGISNNPDCVAGFDAVHDIEWSRNPLHLRELQRGLAQIRTLVRDGGYDIVHVHTPIAAFLTRFALRNRRGNGGPRVIYTAHGFHFHPGGHRLKNLVFMLAERTAARWTDDLVVINRTDEAAARRWIIDEPRLTYMPGIGVDTSLYAKERVGSEAVAAVRAEMGLASDTPLFLMIAELNPGKRHLDALDAFARIERRDAHLAFAGIGPMRDVILQRIEALGLAGRVHLLGYRRDIPTLIRASVATLLPSEREGLPRAVMESLCLEVPVIGTRIRGVADLLESGGGVLVPVGDAAAIATAMQQIVDDPQGAARMGRTGRERMADYDLQQIIRLHERLYARALTQGGRPAPSLQAG